VDADEGFAQFVHARSAALARTAYLLTGDVHLAEDLLQDALSRVASRWPQICSGGDPEPYVRRVLYHRAIDGRRRRAPVEVLSYAPRELAGPGDDTEAVTSRLVLRDALLQLTARQRAVLVLRFFEDRTEVEAATLLGCSVSTVKSQSRHALGRLRVLVPELAETFDRHPVEEPT
jgi:RNA polymerase sigma-70 factor (sigma-E family)